jgi:hypothetical protein
MVLGGEEIWQREREKERKMTGGDVWLFFFFLRVVKKQKKKK